ncbi:MAG: hypothetical protein LQ352_001149 [Teloschistes flavicans]|nr:MAG: hypothetical protein LQ352_001149 [Teloschistes flavicans]
MRTAPSCLGAVALLTALAGANELGIDNSKDLNRQQCSGMYSRKSWGGDTDPYILTTLNKASPPPDQDVFVSLVIFEYRDEDLIGVWPSPDAVDKEYICTQPNVDRNFCNSTQLGKFILSPNASDSKNQILSTKINLKDPEAPRYEVKKTGYYCVGSAPFSADAQYKGNVEFRNAYGRLPAAQIAKLPFYAGITIAYAVIGIFWGFLYAQNRHDILPVQNYITAIIVFLIVEQLMTWGFYDYKNTHGFNAGAKVFMLVDSILNAGRNSFSFFLLLIVCMGYGVVKPTLGKTMVYVRFLAIAHFVFGVIYAVASLSITPDNAGPLVLFVILPLAGTLTAFYVWTLSSLNITMKDLLTRKQHVKALMYKKLWYAILASILVICAFFFLNSFTFAERSSPDFVPNHWKTRWFILDGWLNLVYMVDIAYVAYLWRPTANNRRFAMSDEIAQDDEGFEIASFGESADEEDARSPTREEIRNAGASGAAGAGAGRGGDVRGKEAELSPVPPKPVSEAGASGRGQRSSLDGETIFAVGEEGERWSEDDESPRDSGERQKLTGKKD